MSVPFTLFVLSATALLPCRFRRRVFLLWCVFTPPILVRFAPIYGAFAPHLVFLWCVSTPPFWCVCTPVRLHPTFSCDYTPPFLRSRFRAVRLYPTSNSTTSMNGFVALHRGHHMCFMCPAGRFLLSLPVAYIFSPHALHLKVLIYLFVFLISLPTEIRQTVFRTRLCTLLPYRVLCVRFYGNSWDRKGRQIPAP